MSPRKYTKEYFIAKFEAIPSDKIIKHMLHGPHGQACVLGHCGVFSALRKPTEEAEALEDLLGGEAAWINDGDCRYTQCTPKGRILAALRDLP